MPVISSNLGKHLYMSVFIRKCKLSPLVFHMFDYVFGHSCHKCLHNKPCSTYDTEIVSLQALVMAKYMIEHLKSNGLYNVNFIEKKIIYL